MSYTTAEAVEEIYNARGYLGCFPGAPEDFVDWAVQQGFTLDENIVNLYEQCEMGIYESLEAFAAHKFPGMEWQALLEAGYWQGDYSDMVFRPLTERV